MTLVGWGTDGVGPLWGLYIMKEKRLLPVLSIMSSFPFAPPPGDSWAIPGARTCASSGPVLGAHEAPHGVISGVAVLPIEAVPASCGHGPQPQGPAPRGPSSCPTAPAPETHLPERVAIADCPWIPSGSSCKGSGRSAWSSGWRGGQGLQGPAPGR